MFIQDFVAVAGGCSGSRAHRPLGCTIKADRHIGLQEAQRLYENACDKAKALLEDEPQNVAAWRASSQALFQLSLLLQPAQPGPAQECVQVRHLLGTTAASPP